jgi:hypothetical protein
MIIICGVRLNCLFLNPPCVSRFSIPSRDQNISSHLCILSPYFNILFILTLLMCWNISLWCILKLVAGTCEPWKSSLYLLSEEDVECSVLSLFKRQGLKIQERPLGSICSVKQEWNLKINKHINWLSYTKIQDRDMNSIKINLFCLFTFPFQWWTILAYFLKYYYYTIAKTTNS